MTTDAILLALAPDARSLKAAQEVRNSLHHLSRSEDRTVLRATCQGSATEPYQVRVQLNTSFAGNCTCESPKYPCKHMLALVALHRDPETSFDTFVPSARDAMILSEARTITLPEPPPAPHSAGEALLQAIMDCPSDDAARLIYADWLLDNGGDAELAEFIGLQTRLEREGDNPAWQQWQQRADSLWKARRKDWLEHVPLPLRKKVSPLGGLVRVLEATSKQLLRHGSHLANHYPIDHVLLTGAISERDASQLAVLRLWSRVRWLTLGNAQTFYTPLSVVESVRLPAFSALMQSGYLTALRQLQLSGIDLKHLRVLAQAPLAAGLEELVIAQPSLSAEAAASLGLPAWKALRRVTLYGVEAKPALVKALREALGDRFTIEELS